MTITEKKMNADFAKGCPDSFEPSGDWSNGSMFNVTWRRTSCTYEDGKLQLTIDKDPKGDSIPYSGADSEAEPAKSGKCETGENKQAAQAAACADAGDHPRGRDAGNEAAHTRRHRTQHSCGAPDANPAG